MQTAQLALGAVWYIVFLFSTTCHEAAHALAAKWGGDPTAFEGGQVTLNPIPHIRRSRFGMVLVPILSFLVMGWMIGWASAPYDPHWQQTYPRRAGWMALAGPTANFLLMMVAGLAIRIGVAFGVLSIPVIPLGFSRIAEAAGSDPTFLSTFLSILFVLNLLLFIFNLLPVPPLDGYTGIMVLMPESTAVSYLSWTRRSANFALIGLVLAWTVFDRIFAPVFAFALHTLYAGAR